MWRGSDIQERQYHVQITFITKLILNPWNFCYHSVAVFRFSSCKYRNTIAPNIFWFWGFHTMCGHVFHLIPTPPLQITTVSSRLRSSQLLHLTCEDGTYQEFRNVASQPQPHAVWKPQNRKISFWSRWKFVDTIIPISCVGLTLGLIQAEKDRRY